jgi:hypothetical protein
MGEALHCLHAEFLETDEIEGGKGMLLQSSGADCYLIPVATMIFSSTLIAVKSRGFWKVWAMPRLALSWGRRRVTSWPSK